MIVAVSVLSIGMVLVLRSLLTASSAAGYMSDRVEAVRVLEDKAAKLEELAYRGGLEEKQASEDVFINYRRAIYNEQVRPQEAAASPDGINRVVTDITLSLSWQEGQRACREILATRVVNTKREEDAALPE